MIIVTHELGFAKNVSDKIMFMADGVVEAFGTPDEVFSGSDNTKLLSFLGGDVENR
jgi:ABC-type histidine transport system ATPase subunit